MNTKPNNAEHADETKSWPERNVNLINWGLIVVCGLTLVAQLVFPMYDEHHPPHFAIEKVFGFQALFGFVAFIGVVFLGWLLRKFVGRKEDYYDS